jgi:hypothetical protein
MYRRGRAGDKNAGDTGILEKFASFHEGFPL